MAARRRPLAPFPLNPITLSPGPLMPVLDTSRASGPAARRPATGRLAARIRTAGAALALTGLLAACGGAPADAAAADPAPPATVLTANDVAVVRMADLTTGIALTGSLEPAERVALTAQVGGTITNLRVDRGSPVRRGQALATIRAEGVRSQAAGAEANVAAAQANVELARRQRDAAQRLFQAGATSSLDAQGAQAAFEAAEAQLAAARAQAVATREDAARTVITAPITGSVSARHVEAGEAVSAGDPILTVVNTSVLELAGRIPVDRAAGVRVGQPVAFALGAFPGREFAGTVARIDPAADPETRQVGVYVRLPNAKGEIIAGQFARGRVAGQRVENAVVVPVSAVQGVGSAAAVYVIEGGTLSRRAVQTGARDEASGLVAITSGLKAGDRVLARPSAELADGTPVVVADDQAAASGTQGAMRGATRGTSAGSAPAEPAAVTAPTER